jgi:hypothetical protein
MFKILLLPSEGFKHITDKNLDRVCMLYHKYIPLKMISQMSKHVRTITSILNCINEAKSGSSSLRTAGP